MKKCKKKKKKKKKMSFELLRMDDQLMQFHSQDCDARAPPAHAQSHHQICII